MLPSILLCLFFQLFRCFPFFFFFFFNDTATTEIYTLSLHDALPISIEHGGRAGLLDLVDQVFHHGLGEIPDRGGAEVGKADRKSTRLNSSHSQISYAVFCLKKKKKRERMHTDESE